VSILSSQAENCLRTALASPLGIQIRILEDGEGVVTPSLRAKQILYRFRREIGDVELNKISVHFCPSDPDHRLWLLKMEAAGGEDQ
jgi:hypothetical protein